MQTEVVHHYLEQHSDASRIVLVGPLASSDLTLIEPVLFVDGGAHQRSGGIGVSLGDGDSFNGPMDVPLDPTKDFSDLAFTLRQIGPRFNRLHLHGFLGGRRDHELLNLGELFHFLTDRVRPTRITLDTAVEAFSAGEWIFDAVGTFSLVLFAPGKISLAGNCRYPIPAGTMVKPLSSFGLSNEGSGRMQLNSDGPVFIFHDQPLDLSTRE